MVMKNLLVVTFSMAVFSSQAFCQDEPAPAAQDSATQAAPATDVKPDEEIKPAEEAQPALRPVKEGEGMFGPFRIGPTVAVGLIHPITYGLDFTWDRTFGAAFSMGSYTLPLGFATLGINNWDIRGRWFPWQGSFFLGAAYGNQSLWAEIKKDILVSGQKANTKMKMEVETTYLTPHLGWFATWDSGFTMGFELGYQMALSSKAKDIKVTTDEPTVTTTSDFEKQQKDVKKAAEDFGKKSVPYITLLRLGWML